VSLGIGQILYLFFTLISRKERTRANFQGCDQYTFIDYFSQEGKEVKLVMEVQRGR
jgi:hypothetical protein